jgi:hypothetical protein
MHGVGEVRFVASRGGPGGSSLVFVVDRGVWDAVEAPIREAWAMSFLNKIPPGGRAPSAGLAAPDDDFRSRYPALWEHMSSECYADGSKRKTSTVSFFRGPQGWHASVHDRDNQRVGWVTARSLEELLERLEQQCSDGDAVWRNDAWAAGNTKRQK